MANERRSSPLVDVGFLHLRKRATATIISVNPACCTGLPHAADAVMGMLAPRPYCPDNLPEDVTVRPLRRGDWGAVRRIYAEAWPPASRPSRQRSPAART